MHISLIIPTYHSAGFIARTVGEIERYASGSEHRFEVVVVDDGSLDGTFEELKRLAAQSSVAIKAIQLFTNRGQFQALMAGFSHATGDYLVTLDDDLEYAPEQIDHLVAGFEEEPGRWDVVIGIPVGNRRNLFRRMGTRFKDELNWVVFERPRNIRSGCFRMMTAEFAAKLLDFRTSNPLIGPLIFKATRRIRNVEVEHSRSIRPSNYSVVKLIETFNANLQNFSAFPLKYISLAGLGLASFALLMTLYFLVRYYTGWPKPIEQLGWTSLIVAITFFSGAILFSLGFIGQYVFRIIEEVNKSPNYQVRDVVDNRED